jgi:hypothetical protein
MFQRRLNDTVAAFIARLESLLANPPAHIEWVEPYKLHLKRAIRVLQTELELWNSSKKRDPMFPTHMSEDSADFVIEALKMASWCAFVPMNVPEDCASSGVISVDEPVGESGVVSVAGRAAFVPIEASSRQGRS